MESNSEKKSETETESKEGANLTEGMISSESTIKKVVSSIKWPATIVIIVAMLIFGLPPLLGEFHGKIPKAIEKLGSVESVEQKTNYGYKVTYGFDFLPTMFRLIGEDDRYSLIPLIALAILMVTPAISIFVNLYLERRRIKLEELPLKNQHLLNIEQINKDHKIKLDESDKAHEQQMLEKNNVHESQMRDKANAHESQMKDKANAHEQEMKNKEHENENKLEHLKNQDKADERAKNIDLVHAKNKGEQQRQSHIQHLHGLGKTIRIKLIKKGFVDAEGNEPEIGTIHLVSQEEANTLINAKIAVYEPKSDE